MGWLHIAYGHILRLPCLEFGNFSIVKADFRQNGTVLAAFANLSESECEDHCVKNWLCKSININNDTCELNSKSSEDPFDGGELSKEAGWTYKSTDYKELNVGQYPSFGTSKDVGSSQKWGHMHSGGILSYEKGNHVA